MTCDAYFLSIDKCGWFDTYPTELKQKILEKIERYESMPWLALVFCGGDAECIYEDGDYTRQWINPLIENSNALFAPQSIVEEWEPHEEYTRIRISFSYAGRDYKTSFRQDTDYVKSSLFKLIDNALHDNTLLRLIEIPSEGQEAYFVLTTLEAYIKAYLNNLIPHWGIDPFDQDNWKRSLPCSLSWHLMKEKEMEEIHKETQPSQLSQNSVSGTKENMIVVIWKALKALIKK